MYDAINDGISVPCEFVQVLIGSQWTDVTREYLERCVMFPDCSLHIIRRDGLFNGRVKGTFPESEWRWKKTWLST